jgi:hypothetical protein
MLLCYGLYCGLYFAAALGQVGVRVDSRRVFIGAPVHVIHATVQWMPTASQAATDTNHMYMLATDQARPTH